ncbi:MAG: hypothetical protein R3B95_21365 [Nitrospirales bacterium]|nr:hypothetical protein [Nitrospirales bacterium]
MDSQEELNSEDLPPVNLPENLRMQVIGFEDSLARTVGNEIADLVGALSRYWPLNNLIGLTIAYDYAAALAAVDQGFGENAPPPQATNDEELGRGSAMALSVLHGGIWKTHVVFGPHLVGLLSSDEEGEKDRGYKLVAHELAHAADHENKRQAFGEIISQPVTELIPDPKEQYLWERSHFIWDEYYASRMSVGFDPEGEGDEDELFATSYIACRDRIQKARREYHWHQISLEEFLEVLKQNLHMVLLAAGYLFGLGDGLEKDLTEVAPKSTPLLQEDLGQAIMRFHAVLLALWEHRREWASYDEFLTLNGPAEALLNDLDLYVHTEDEGRVYIDIPPRVEHLCP